MLIMQGPRSSTIYWLRKHSSLDLKRLERRGVVPRIKAAARKGAMGGGTHLDSNRCDEWHDDDCRDGVRHEDTDKEDCSHLSSSTSMRLVSHVRPKGRVRAGRLQKSAIVWLTSSIVRIQGCSPCSIEKTRSTMSSSSPLSCTARPRALPPAIRASRCHGRALKSSFCKNPTEEVRGDRKKESELVKEIRRVIGTLVLPTRTAARLIGCAWVTNTGCSRVRLRVTRNLPMANPRSSQSRIT
eukprot:scaffold127222_cov32-Tisochrysis_lutea.AAC.4